MRRFDEQTVVQVVEGLLDRGLLDDAAFAAAWRDSREQFHPRSSTMVRYELLTRGVERSVADDAVVEMDNDNAARQAASMYAKRLKTVDARQAGNRMWAYLARRGFSPDVIQRTIRWLAQEPAV